MKQNFGVLLLFGFSFVSMVEMAEQPDQTYYLVKEFFPNEKDNLTAITWAHAVNSKALLETAINDNKIMMLEADIVLGTLISDPSKIIPIMGHPPANTSDLSLQMFLDKVWNHNNNTDKNKKGVKLDFKSIDVFEQSADDVVLDEYEYPMWLNADILPGPGNPDTVPVDAKRFLNKCEDYPYDTLSVGWTTKYGGGATNTSYTQEHIDDMLKLVNESIAMNIANRDAETHHRIFTFPVRAGIAANSHDLMLKLIDQVANSTLTIWSSDGDYVDIKKLKKLILDAGLKRVYLDVPEEVSSELRLDSKSSGCKCVRNAALIGVAMFAVAAYYVAPYIIN